MPSTIPSFKAALLARLQANAGLAAAQISWGNPYPARMADELIIIGNATAGQNPVGLGSNAKEEQYELEILVSIAGSARTSQQTLEERAFTLAGVIETSIINWRTEASPFGGVVSWALVDSMSSGEGISQSGDTREASVSIKLSVTARI